MVEGGRARAASPRGARRDGIGRRLALVLAGTVVALLLAEGAVRALGLDWRMVSRTLYYQSSDLAVHQESPDPRLHYELRPGAWATLLTHEDEKFTVRVDRFGARGAGHPEPKGEGVFRVLFFGASTLYGVGLEDHETMPAVMERLLAEREAARPDRAVPPRRYEVWNFGTSAYVLSQMAVLARERMERHDPDLVLVLCTNRTRRAFLPATTDTPTECARWFDLDPGLYPENFPAPPRVPEGLHLAAMRATALYRYYGAYRRARFSDNTSEAAAALDARESGALNRAAAARGVPVAYVVAPGVQDEFRWETTVPDLPGDRLIDLREPGHPPDWYLIHPEAGVMAEHARLLVHALVGRGLLP